jgi:hypothetical protein
MHPDTDDSDDHLVVSYLTLRRMLGLLGIALPFVLYFGGLILFSENLQHSLSEYYHTDMRDVFVGAIIAIGMFLFAYTGYKDDEPISDKMVANFAGACAVGLALFRTTGPDSDADLVGVIHVAFSALFFLSLAYMSYFLFTKTDPSKPPTPQKLARNRIYEICAYVMLVAVVAIAAFKWLLPQATQDAWNAYAPVFWLEALAIVAFGVSWLIKGETLLRDEAV